MRRLFSWAARPFVLGFAWVGLYCGQLSRLVGRIKDRIIAHPVLLLFLATFGVVAWLNPAKIGLLLYGIAKLVAFAHAGNWVDLRFFTEAQPQNLKGIEQGTAWKRKAMIIAASILAGAWLP